MLKVFLCLVILMSPLTSHAKTVPQVSIHVDALLSLGDAEKIAKQEKKLFVSKCLLVQINAAYIKAPSSELEELAFLAQHNVNMATIELKLFGVEDRIVGILEQAELRAKQQITNPRICIL